MNKDVAKTNIEVFKVLIEWFSPENGGRHHIPKQGIYYCTTEIVQEHRKSTWSISLQLNEMSPKEAEMWFLFNDDERRVEVEGILNLLEGPRCIGQIMIQ